MLRERPKVALRKPGRTIVSDEAAANFERRLSAAEDPSPPQGRAVLDTERSNVQTLERSDAQTPIHASGLAGERLDVQMSDTDSDPRVIMRKGRLLADGSRSGARTLRRMTVYLPPDLGQRLDLHAVSRGRDRSDILAEALRAWLDRE